MDVYYTNNRASMLIMGMINRLLVLGISLFSFMACGQLPDFGFCNNSDCDVNYVIIRRPREHPDTVLPIKEDWPFGEMVLQKKGGCTGRWFNVHEELVVHFYVFDPDTVNVYSWDELRAGNKYLKRYDLYWKDFYPLKHNVSYPPTDAMRDVKMYPPYGTNED